MVKQAMQILTPAMPGCMEDGNVVQGHDKGFMVIGSKQLILIRLGNFQAFTKRVLSYQVYTWTFLKRNSNLFVTTIIALKNKV